MSLNQLLACCNCGSGRLPCVQCNSNRCNCVEQPDGPSQIPVTSVNIEVADLSVGAGTSQGRSDSGYAHFFSKDLQKVNENESGPKNRTVFSTTDYWINGIRYGDPQNQEYLTRLSDCSYGQNVATSTPEAYGDDEIPCFINENVPDDPDREVYECPHRSSDAPCAPTYCYYYENLLWQISNVWNFTPDDCSSQTLGGTNFNIDFDYPCKETEEAYLRSEEKYAFGQQRYAEAVAFCANNPDDEKCGPNSDCAALCHPAAKDLIGARGGAIIPCIEHCPTQKVCDYDNALFPEVQYPDGSIERFGHNVEQSISCMQGSNAADVPTGPPCEFLTTSVEKNFAARRGCTHQCGPKCPSQLCCLVECFDVGCCDQLDYNPATGETSLLDDDGCMVDEEGNYIGGWKIQPNANGEYERCPRPLTSCLDEFGNVLNKGCRNDPTDQFTTECSSDDDCCPSGTGFIGGDVRQWSIPRKLHPVLSQINFGSSEPPQGIYIRHCPDTIEPFTPRASSFGNSKCSNLNAPTVGQCKGGPLFAPCEYPDKHCPQDPKHNPVGMICSGGRCEPSIEWTGGTPVHECPDQTVPATHDPDQCGQTICHDTVGDDGLGCVRRPCIENGGCGRPPAENCNDCFSSCTTPVQYVYANGTNEYEMGLQHIGIACSVGSWEERRSIIDFAFRPAPPCNPGEPRQLYSPGRAFTVSLEYEGGGDGKIALSKSVNRIGGGSFIVAQNETDEMTCLFGEYSTLVGGQGYIGGGGAPPPPEAGTDINGNEIPNNLFANWALHSGCYYPYTRNQSECADGRAPVPAVPRAQTSTPMVVIS